jgi:hypothetical protein
MESLAPCRALRGVVGQEFNIKGYQSQVADLM